MLKWVGEHLLRAGHRDSLSLLGSGLVVNGRWAAVSQMEVCMCVFIGTQLRDGLVGRPAGHSVWVSEGRGCPYLTLCMNVCIQHNREPPCLQPRDHAPFLAS